MCVGSVVSALKITHIWNVEKFTPDSRMPRHNGATPLREVREAVTALGYLTKRACVSRVACTTQSVWVTLTQSSVHLPTSATNLSHPLASLKTTVAGNDQSHTRLKLLFVVEKARNLLTCERIPYFWTC